LWLRFELQRRRTSIAWTSRQTSASDLPVIQSNQIGIGHQPQDREDVEIPPMLLTLADEVIEKSTDFR
jgi:hypothetical protein